MTRTQGPPALLWAALLSCVPVVSAADDALGVIVAGVIAGVILLLLCIGLVLFCFFKRLGPNEQRQKHKKMNHKVFVANGGHPRPPREYSHPPPSQHYEKHHQPQYNGYIKHPYPAPWMPPEPSVITPAPMPPPYMEPFPVPPVHVPYATYHGPPPDFRYQRQGPSWEDTMSGPPPIVIPIEMLGARGTVTLRPNSRPGVHTSKYQKREPLPNMYADDRKRSHSKHRSPSRHRSRSEEFVIQQTYDGTPVIRQVVYVDDDENGRHKHRSKSRDRLHKKKSSSTHQDGARVIEITDDTEVKVVQAEIEPAMPSRSLSPTMSPAQHERSRTSSVTEAVNALRMSVKGHDVDTSSQHSSSRAPSFQWSHAEEQRAPDPVAGDVMFFPAGVDVEHSRDNDPQAKPKDDIYSYTKRIKSSIKEKAPSPLDSQEQDPVSIAYVNEGYEVPTDLRRSTAGTREEEPSYHTEHDHVTGVYNHIGASMSDRLQNLVEDGDKTRFSHYNVGAMDFAEDEESVQMRVSRPNTQPADMLDEDFYSQVIRRPKTPPNDIPLVSPRESTEVPPLNLRSTINSPREPSYRPATPPKDFPITPQSSIVRPRPADPPTDFPMTPNQSAVSPRPPSPPYDVLESNRTWLGDSQKSVAADPSTGEPGSFEARRRLIEAHLQNAQSPPSVPTPQTSAPRPRFAPTPQRNVAPLVTVTPGVVPPAPPPPPPAR